jgi:hypothetical protein
MKTFIIATMLTAGVLLQPATVPTGSAEHQMEAVTATSIQSQALDNTNLNAIIGQGLNCSGEIDRNGTSVYYTCCASIWIIRVCVSIYVGEIPAPLPK